MIELLNQSVELLKFDPSTIGKEEVKSPKKGRRKQVVETPVEVKKKPPFAHIKCKNIEKIINAIRCSNDKKAQ